MKITVSSVIISALTLFLSGLPLFAAALPASSTIKVQGKILIVNNSSFTIKGVCYSAIPAGKDSSYDWVGDANTYNTDLPLIAAMGANTVRTYSTSSNSTAVQAFLDAAAANGLYVILGYWVGWNQDYSDAATRASVITTFTTFVNRWKGHRAVLMWNFGNEVYNNTTSKPGWYTLLNDAAAAAHAAEGANYHPVTTAIPDTEITYANAHAADVAALDLWGLNIYRGRTFTDLFTTFTSTKPFFMSEFGCDAYDKRIENSSESLQSDVEKSQWQDMASHFSASFPAESCLGGTVFEWCDEWWKSFTNPLGNSKQDTVTDWTNAAYDDPSMNEEWWGMAGIANGTYKKTLRKTYYTFLGLWGGSVSIVNNDDTTTVGTGIFQDEVRNFPNPFVCGGVNTTKIRFKVNGSPLLKIELYNLSGAKVRELTGISTSGNVREAYWDGKDSDQSAVPFGLYICKVKATTTTSEEVKYRKIAVIK